MKAAVYHGVKDIRVEDVPEKKVGDHEVSIAIKFCGVCGTDIHIYNGDGGSFPVKPPLIPGHEFSGIVTEVGKNVNNIQVGDHVTANPNNMCGKCYFCQNGMEHFCTNAIGIGTTHDGGFAEQIVMDARYVYKVPDNMDFKIAAMAEPVSCCLNGIDLCNIKSGDTVLVMGGGPIGIIMLQLAKFAGAAKVILSEPVEEKRKLGLAVGADYVIDPIHENVQEFLDGVSRNVNCVIECVGNPHTQEDAIKFAGKKATIMYFGLVSPDDYISISPDQIFKKELTITSSFINPYTFDRAIEMLEMNRIDVTSIIANVLPLDEINQVFENVELRRNGKVMIQVS